MTERVLGPTGGRRRQRLALLVPFIAIAALVLAIGAAAAPGDVSQAAGFEGNDGNLAPGDVVKVGSASPNFDWNSFAPGLTWTGPAPDRTSTNTVSGWLFVGQEDAQITTSDDAFAGGTKQDDDCASVGTAKAPNKDDLERIYLATKNVAGKVYLALAWVRIPQNTTSASAHVGFEFNQGITPCPAGSDGLVRRTAGDMLIVYDFEGSSTDAPNITLRRWVTTPANTKGLCEVSSNSTPCWGPATNLTTGGFAEGKVNTSDVGSVIDSIAPVPPETLGNNEFGEAIIDLTGAGVFGTSTCASFGTAFGVSRSSGNSAQAQMKDLVGPVDFELANCGSLKIIKQTDPRGVNQNFGFTSDITTTTAGSQLSCTADATPAAFTLNDNNNSGKTLGSFDAAQNSAGNTESCSNLLPGTYTVTEDANPTGFALTNITCQNSGGSATPDLGNRRASITVAAGSSATCIFRNAQQTGAIKITKTSKKSGDGLNGATFSITKGGTAITGSPFTTATVGGVAGVICVGNLVFGDYVVTETAPPSGFAIDTTAGQTVAVDNAASCSDSPYVGETKAFTDTPLADIQVRFRDGGSGETALDGPAASNLTCNNGTGTSNRDDTAGWDDTLTVTGVKVDGVAVVTITCTIKIDP